MRQPTSRDHGPSDLRDQHEEDQQERERREYGETLLADALERLRQAAAAPSPGPGTLSAQLTAVKSALDAVDALDEHHRRRVGKHRYWRDLTGDGRGGRNDHPEGQAVAGHLYVRNLAHHQLVRALHIGWAPMALKMYDHGSGQLIPMTMKMYDHVSSRWLLMEMRRAAVSWKPLAELPDPEQPERHGRDKCYAEHLAGRDATQTLLVAQRFLTETVWQLLP